MVQTHAVPRPYRVLVSDDDDACRQTVRDALASQGYEMRVASCGREAIDIARTHLLHVMIVDMNMPDMSGLDAVMIIRREVSAPAPSILMSADTSRELMIRALQAHFDSFLPKPFDVGALRHIVEGIIRRYYETD